MSLNIFGYNEGNIWSTFSIGSGNTPSYEYDVFGRRWKWT